MPLPPDTPPPVGPRGLAMRVAIQGADAYAAGVPLSRCPYGATRPYARRAWAAGYGSALRMAGATPPDVDAIDDDAPAPNA